MRAAGEPLKLEELPVPPLRAGELLVRVACCTVCGSDLHTWTGRRDAALPTILGHEAVGVVVDAGADRPHDGAGAPLSIGDRVVWTIHGSCGQCDYCRDRGMPMKCRSLRKFGHERCDRPPYLVGGMADHAVVEAGMTVYRVPDSLPDEVAAPAACAGATAVAACQAARLGAADRVLIIGAGALGAYAAAYAAQVGCSAVLATDRCAGRLGAIRRFGATAAVTANGPPDAVADSLREAVSAATEGEGVDAVIEVAGAPQAAAASLALLRVGGRLVTCGCVFPGAEARVDLSLITKNRLTITGLHNYHAEHLGEALELLEATIDRRPWRSLVGERFALGRVNEALGAALTRQSLRVAIT